MSVWLSLSWVGRMRGLRAGSLAAAPSTRHAPGHDRAHRFVRCVWEHAGQHRPNLCRLDRESRCLSWQTVRMTGLTAELVVDGRAPQTPVLAPNGRMLCYVRAPTSWTGDHLDTELWLADTDGAAAPRRMTVDASTESLPRWSADSGTLFF